MIDFRAFRAVAIAGAMAACAAVLTSAPAQAQDGTGPWSEIRDARQDYRADTRDLRREFRVERREDRIDWHQGDYDSAGEFVRDRAGDRRSARQQHRIDRRDFRQDLRQIRH